MIFSVYFFLSQNRKICEFFFSHNHAGLAFGNANKRFKRVLRGFRAFPPAFASILKKSKNMHLGDYKWLNKNLKTAISRKKIYRNLFKKKPI